ncbi:MAG: hypothetical protein ACYTKD_14885 [Planctomycetota bacterium]|jgi:hypothetical protein
MGETAATVLVMLLFVALPVGLLLTLVVLAIRKAFTDGRKCSECGESFYPVRSRDPQDVCPGCLSEKRSGGGRAGGGGGKGSCLLVTFFLACGMALFEWLLYDLVFPDWTAYPTGAVLFLFCLIAVSRRWRRVVTVLAELQVRRSERLDLAAAGRAAGRGGTVLRSDGLVMWTDAAGWDGVTVARVFEGACKVFAQVTGLGRAASPPLRAFLFEREEALKRYTHGIADDPGRIAGYYMHWPTRRLLVCADVAERGLLTTRGALAHEFSHHLLRAVVGSTPPPWLDEGTATLVAREVAGMPVEPAAGLRASRVALARKEFLSGGSLLGVARLRLARAMAKSDDLDQWAFVAGFYMQSAGFVQYLHDAHPEPLARFVSRVGRARAQQTCFRESFGVSPGEAMRELVAKIEADEIPPHTAPPEGAREKIETQFVGRIESDLASKTDRRLAIRTMGAAGWAWRADVLIDILERPEDDMRPEALRALENISGELRGDDPAAPARPTRGDGAPARRPERRLRRREGAWREWLGSLPEGVAAGKARSQRTEGAAR